MDAPTVACENKFKLKNKDSSLTLYLSNESNSLVIKIIEDDSVPLRTFAQKFTLEDLIKQSRYFKLFENIDQLIPEIKSLFEENKVSFSVETSLILLILNLPLKIIEEVILSIPQSKADTNQIISELCSTVNDLRKRVKYLENQITKIPEEKLKENLSSKDIILNEEEKKMINNWILKKLNQENKTVEMNLLYKLTRDGDSSSTFHSKCNGQGYTLSLIRTTLGYRSGGFTTQSWSSSGGYKNDKNAFLFSLDYKECYFTFDGINAIYDNSGNGPTFGNGYDLYIANSCSQNNSSYCNFPYSYGGGKYRVFTGGYYYFKVHEIEVYQIKIV